MYDQHGEFNFETPSGNARRFCLKLPLVEKGFKGEDCSPLGPYSGVEGGVSPPQADVKGETRVSPLRSEA
jgi:hypothetical protein